MKKEIDRVGAEAAAGIVRYIKSNAWKRGYVADGFRMKKGKRVAISVRPRRTDQQLASVLERIKQQELLDIKKWETAIKEENDPVKLGRFIQQIQTLPFRREESKTYLQELLNKRLEELKYSATAEVELIEREIGERAGPRQLLGLQKIIKTRAIPEEEKERLIGLAREKIESGRTQFRQLNTLIKTSTDPTIVRRAIETARVSDILGPKDREALIARGAIRLEMIERRESPV